MDSESESIIIIHNEKSPTTQNLQTDSDFLDSSRLQIREKICANVIVIQTFVTLSAVSLWYFALALSCRPGSAPAEEHRHREAAKHGDPTHCPPTTLPTIREYPADPSRIPVSLPLLLPLPLAPVRTSISVSLHRPLLFTVPEESQHPSAPPFPPTLPERLSDSPSLCPALSLGCWWVEGCGF